MDDIESGDDATARDDLTPEADASDIRSQPDPRTALQAEPQACAPGVREFGGRKGPEPTRYGDWEKNGRCTDF